jgi:hypothetical protein
LRGATTSVVSLTHDRGDDAQDENGGERGAEEAEHGRE